MKSIATLFRAASAAGILGVCGAAAAAEPVHITFENGNEGWSVSGRTDHAATGGNPGACMDVILIDVFGADIRNDNEDPRFIGDYRAIGGGNGFRLSVDVKIDSIDFFGMQVSRTLVVDLRDTTNPPENYPWVSVWAELGTITASEPGWHTYSIEVTNPNSATLPPGWGGTGDETPLGEPKLPTNRTFSSVLASVDALHFTTFVPGYFYGFTNFTMQVDNIKIEPLGGTPSCPADWNDVDGVTVQDIYDFLTDWSEGTADFNGENGTTVQDIYDFLTEWSAGCGG